MNSSVRMLTLVIVGGYLVVGSCASSAATQADFDSANNAISAAFISVHDTGQGGGNISRLISRLNVATGLLDKSLSENSTDSSAASADLQNATLIAQQVSSAAPAFKLEGASVQQNRLVVSIGSAGFVLVTAGLAYLFGERLRNRLWYRLHSKHVVKKNG